MGRATHILPAFRTASSIYNDAAIVERKSSPNRDRAGLSGKSATTVVYPRLAGVSGKVRCADVPATAEPGRIQEDYAYVRFIFRLSTLIQNSQGPPLRQAIRDLKDVCESTWPDARSGN